jgi:hypothetical protein
LLRDCIDTVAASKRELACKQGRVAPDIWLVNVQPDRKYHDLTLVDLDGGERVEFSPRPRLAEERTAQDDDAEA